MQKNARDYFDKDSITYKKSSSIIPENIIEIEELIVQLRNDTIFLNSIYYEEDGAYYEPLKEIIFEYIDNYKNKNDEKILLENSKNCIIYLDGYYIETFEGNIRNWLYPIEIECEFIRLEIYIKKLNEKLREKIVNIGLELAFLSI
tara:strand:- start:636 stop:1073 length:438 start_codon:yes stop_codon:yes gene_type:complete